jgi:A/G-specific adenine glycosylase
VPDASGFAPALLAWFAAHGRRELPWQRKRTAYRVWVSEIMLQQTQVATVIPYFERFTAQFPDVRRLADARLDVVLHLWSGLGYYARARNLHRAAQEIRDRHGGEFPRDVAAAVALPGIGRSTAGAILALARDERHPILDGNVKRVLARWFGVEGFPGAPRITAQLWRLSEAVTPAGSAADFTQAIMDLGATVCTRTNPDCQSCPVAVPCVARAGGRQGDLPAPRPPRERPRRAVWWLVFRHEEGVLLEQRPAAGIWGGLWSFPEFPTRAAAEDVAAARIGCGARDRPPLLCPWPPISHSFTHFDLDIRPLVCELAGPDAPMEAAGRTWYNSRAPAQLGLAAPVATLIEALFASPMGVAVTGKSD